MLQIATVTISASLPEDRLVLLCRARPDQQGGAASMIMLLTRRLTARLLPRLSGLLERTSAVAQRAPADMRAEIILMERQIALAQQPPAGAPQEGDAAGHAPAGQVSADAIILLSRIDLQVQPSLFSITFFDAANQCRAAMDCSREDLHRLLDAINRATIQAEWGINIDASWIGQGESKLVIS